MTDTKRILTYGQGSLLILCVSAKSVLANPAYEAGLKQGHQVQHQIHQAIKSFASNHDGLATKAPQSLTELYQNPNQLTTQKPKKQTPIANILKEQCHKNHDTALMTDVNKTLTQASSPTTLLAPDCQGQPCWHAKSIPNQEFKPTLSKLSLWQLASNDYDHLLFFNGQAATCRVAAFNYVNCCKNTGWGKDINLAKCSKKEKQLAHSKHNGQVIFIGKYCHQQWMGHCKERRLSYCVYQSKLARAIQKNLHSQQRLSFGKPSSPNCQGLTQSQLEALNLVSMDLTDIYDSIKLANLHYPSPPDIKAYKPTHSSRCL